MSYEYFDVIHSSDSPSGKTKICEVVSRHGDHLGLIKWFGRWRQYCFFPSGETIYSKGCLLDVTVALQKLNKDHKKKTELFGGNK